MVKWEKVVHEFNKIKQQLGNPPVSLVDQQTFKELTGVGLNNYVGRYGWYVDSFGNIYYIITLRYRKRTIPQIKKTIYHEIAHILFPSKPHWWIECFAEKLSGCKGYKHWATKYNHSTKDLPSRKKLIELAIKASKRLNSK